MGAAIAGLLAVGSCGGSEGDETAAIPGGEPGGGEPVAGRGWISGEPDWDGSGDDEAEMSAGEGGAAADSAARDSSSSHEEGSDLAAPLAGLPSDGPLRAGSVDDNADLEGYITYLERIASLGIDLRDVDPTGRVVISVTGRTGLPVTGAEVVVSASGREVATLRTTADGTARFLPGLHGAADEQSFDVAVGGESTTAEPGSEVDVELDVDGGAEAPVPVDVLFLLDATGSMGDEIDRLKASIDSVAARISELESRPDVRFGMTLYRDEGDAFVTSTYDFTGDVAAFRTALADVVADGGGDYPEALDEGLAEALAAPAWRDPATTVQVVFLVADAPPQIDRDVAVPYDRSIVDAVGRGVKIFPVASSESDDQAEGVFRQLAQATGARFVFLSYGAGGAATGSSSDIASTDYEELALDDLVVRLVTEELDALTGEATPIPPSDSTTTTTRPDGQ